ncbi:MAG: hypothetical protein ABII72_02055 [Parcubacteria group bacterium]
MGSHSREKGGRGRSTTAILTLRGDGGQADLLAVHYQYHALVATREAVAAEQCYQGNVHPPAMEEVVNFSRINDLDFGGHFFLLDCKVLCHRESVSWCL